MIEIPGKIPAGESLRIVLMIAAAAAYCWLYESWLSDDETSDSELESASLLRLTRKGERIRWRLANVAILVVLIEVFLNFIRSWGIYFALLSVAGGYLSSPYLTTKFGGEIELTPRQQATRRRLGLIPAMVFLVRGTNFGVAPVHAAILVVAGFVFSILVLVPEPRE